MPGSPAFPHGQKQKKPTRLNTQQVQNHVGLLFNGPPDAAGLPSI
jgi:hypothetical protein